MAKISVLSINGKSLEAKVFLVGEQYTQANATVEKFKGKIGKNGEGKMKATFASVKNAEACKKEFDAWYKPSKTTIREDKPRTQNTAPTHTKGEAKLETVKWQGTEWFVVDGMLIPAITPMDREPAKKNAHKGAKSGKKSASTKAKWQTELDKIAHEGKGANSKATKILQKHGFKGSHGTPEWDYWMGVRA